MLIECLSFAFYVAKLQDAVRARILHGTAVSDDDNGEWKGGVAAPEGGATLESIVALEQEEAVQGVYYSEMVAPPVGCGVASRVLPVDVQQKATKAQDETLQ